MNDDFDIDVILNAFRKTDISLAELFDECYRYIMSVDIATNKHKKEDNKYLVDLI